MAWHSTLGGCIFFIALIVAIYLYTSKKKFYPVMLLISISIYVYTVGFIIDVFDFGKEKILLTLGFSALLMIAFGYYLTKRE